MDIDKFKQSPIWASVRDIINGDDNPIKVRVSATVHTQDYDYDAFKIYSIDYIRDYMNAMTDDCQIKLLIPLGDYAYLIEPNKNNIEITVNTIHLQSIGDAEDSSAEIEKVRYKAIFDPSNPTFGSTDVANYTQKTMNNADILTIKFRLMDRNVEPLRIKTVHGIFRGITPEALTQSILLGESQKIIVDDKPAASGIDIVTPDRTEINDQVVIASGTFIYEVPTYLQEKAGGFYKYDIGTYFQRYKGETLWFIYPLYNYNRFDEDKERDVMIFYSVPPRYTGGIERTYRIEPGVVEAIVTSNKVQIDASDLSQLNRGVGYRLADAAAFMKKPIQLDEESSAIGARANLNQELVLLERDDGLNYAPVIRDIATNHYLEISKLSARRAALIRFIWENSDASLIYPGMPVKYSFIQNDEVISIKGTILNVHASMMKQGTLSESGRYTTKCVITIATELNTVLPTFEES